MTSFNIFFKLEKTENNKTEIIRKYFHKLSKLINCNFNFNLHFIQIKLHYVQSFKKNHYLAHYASAVNKFVASSGALSLVFSFYPSDSLTALLTRNY